MLGIIISIIKVVILLGFLIFIHESGHFLVAKLFKVKVLEFAIGFGPTIWSKQGKETKYAIRLIPLGGFVNMLGEEERSEEQGSYSKASIPKRIGILLAGGSVNIIFGILVYFILMGTVNSSYISTTIKEVAPDYSAEIAGIQVEDKILKINEKNIRIKTDVDKILAESNGDNLKILLERDNKKVEVNAEPTKIDTKTIGIYLGVEGDNLSTEIKSLYKGGPAEQAGIKQGDKIVKVDEIEVNEDAYQAVELIQNSPNDKIKITVLRNNEDVDFEITPEISTTYKLGVVFKEINKTFGNAIYYSFWETINFTGSIVDNLKQLFTGNVSVNQLMGPVGISEVVVETKGFQEFFYILALISLSLGVTNLLPFPPLDGGKVVLLIIEAIRRKPLKENIEVGIQMAGFVLLIGLSLFVTFNDIVRIF